MFQIRRVHLENGKQRHISNERSDTNKHMVDKTVLILHIISPAEHYKPEHHFLVKPMDSTL